MFRYTFSVILFSLFNLFLHDLQNFTSINKSFTICDYVKGLEKLYPKNTLCSHKTPQSFQAEIVSILKDWENYYSFRQESINNAYVTTLSNHTYFDRAYNMFLNLDMKEEADHVMFKKKEIIERLKL